MVVDTFSMVLEYISFNQFGHTVIACVEQAIVFILPDEVIISEILK